MNETTPTATPASAAEIVTPEIMPVNPDDVARQLAVVQREAKMDDDNALAIRSNFSEFYDNIVALRAQAATITDPTATGAQKIARTVRLEIKKNRCAVENERKALKAESLARGKFIDGVAGYISTVLCEPVEERLEAIEKHAERMEAARIAAMIETRKARLTAEGVDPAPYNLAAMDDETFVIILNNAKRAKAEKEEAARRAEAERVAREQAEREEAERIRQENERLKAEAAAREEAARVERERAAAELARVEAEAKEQREAAEAQAKADRAEAERKQRESEERERIIKEAAARDMRIQRESRERAEREAAAARAEAKRIADEHRAREQARVEAERAAEAKRIADEQASAARAAAAPDKEKLIAFVAMLSEIELPAMSSAEGQRIANDFDLRLNAMIEMMVQTLQGM